jgi:hypothetical protein
MIAIQSLLLADVEQYNKNCEMGTLEAIPPLKWEPG